MANPEEIFILDDDNEDYVGGGFDSGFDAFEETPEPEEKPEPETKEEPEKDPEPEEKPEEKPEPEERPKPDPAIIAMQAKVNELERKNTQLETEVRRANKPAEKPLEKPAFTPEQWESDPERCSEAMVDYHMKVREQQERAQRDNQQSQQQAAQNQMNQIHNRGWQKSVEMVPELASDPALRNRWAQIFQQYRNDPLGTIEATRQLQQQITAEKPTPKSDPKLEAAKQEAERKKQVKQGTMHGGGKGGGQKKIELSAGHRKAMRQFGVSEEDYIASLKAMGGDFNG